MTNSASLEDFLTSMCKHNASVLAQHDKLNRYFKALHFDNFEFFLMAVAEVEKGHDFNATLESIPIEDEISEANRYVVLKSLCSHEGLNRYQLRAPKNDNFVRLCYETRLDAPHSFDKILQAARLASANLLGEETILALEIPEVLNELKSMGSLKGLNKEELKSVVEKAISDGKYEALMNEPLPAIPDVQVREEDKTVSEEPTLTYESFEPEMSTHEHNEMQNEKSIYSRAYSKSLSGSESDSNYDTLSETGRLSELEREAIIKQIEASQSGEGRESTYDTLSDTGRLSEAERAAIIKQIEGSISGEGRESTYDTLSEIGRLSEPERKAVVEQIEPSQSRSVNGITYETLSRDKDEQSPFEEAIHKETKEENTRSFIRKNVLYSSSHYDSCLTHAPGDNSKCEVKLKEKIESVVGESDKTLLIVKQLSETVPALKTYDEMVGMWPKGLLSAIESLMIKDIYADTLVKDLISMPALIEWVNKTPLKQINHRTFSNRHGVLLRDKRKSSAFKTEGSHSVIKKVAQDIKSTRLPPYIKDELFSEAKKLKGELPKNILEALTKLAHKKMPLDGAVNALLTYPEMIRWVIRKNRLLLSHSAFQAKLSQVRRKTLANRPLPPLPGEESDYDTVERIYEEIDRDKIDFSKRPLPPIPQENSEYDTVEPLYDEVHDEYGEADLKRHQAFVDDIASSVGKTNPHVELVVKQITETLPKDKTYEASKKLLPEGLLDAVKTLVNKNIYVDTLVRDLIALPALREWANKTPLSQIDKQRFEKESGILFRDKRRNSFSKQANFESDIQFLMGALEKSQMKSSLKDELVHEVRKKEGQFPSGIIPALEKLGKKGIAMKTAVSDLIENPQMIAWVNKKNKMMLSEKGYQNKLNKLRSLSESKLIKK